MIAQPLTPPLGAHAATLSQTGRWVSGPSLGFSGTHVAVLRMPGTDTTSVFLFGESGSPQTMKFWRFAAGDTNLRWPTLANTLDLPHPNDRRSDLFCSGHATLPDGKLLLVGGSWLPEPLCQHVYSLDPGWRPTPLDATPWDQNAIMAVERWYATATTLGDGKVLTSAGTMASVTVGFGGMFRTAGGADSTYDRVRPLEQAGRYAWSDTTTIPADDVTDPNVWYDDYTDGKWPPGREGHGFVADGAGRGILLFGRSVGPVSGVRMLDDVWSLRGCKAGVDTMRAWDRFEPVGDASLPVGQQFPVPRHRFAMSWAGVENDLEGRGGLPDALVKQICFIHGGLDANGNVLGDLWRGERRNAPVGAHYQWVWTRLLPDSPVTRRFGHTMVFDPGPPAAGAPYARLVIHGGQIATSPPAFANPAKICLYGVGSDPSVNGTWRELLPATEAYGFPTAVEGHAMAAVLKGNHVVDRRYYMFGGQDAQGSLVSPVLWILKRPDAAVTDTSDYAWDLAPYGPGPSARTRAGLTYSVDGGIITIVGGDTNGSAAPDGFTNEVWTYPVTEYGGEQWRSPPMRSFHTPPPGLAGMPLLTAPVGGARGARSLERFRADASSGAGLDCPALPGQWETVTNQNDAESERPIAAYPYMFLLPDGRLFNAGPSPYGDLGKRYRRFFNLGTRRWEEVAGDQQDAARFGSAVMLQPGKLLRAGGFSEARQASDRTETIDITTAGAMPAWAGYLPAPGREFKERQNHNLTLLPTGDVLATGGESNVGWAGGGAQRQPQIWRTAEARWNDKNNPADTLLWDPNIRNYHSTAILLPDARVMTAGGEKLTGGPPHPSETNTSIYEPPYLFSGDDYASRPRVLGAPAVLAYGRTFTLTLTDPARAAHIKRVALMRPGAVTHSFDQNQRYVPLAFTLASNPTRLLVQAPADGNIAPPGDQMLFILDSLSAGARRVPSIARWTRTEHQGMGLDSADVLPPGKVVDLEGCPHGDQGSGEVSWTEPADDWGLVASGRPVSYDLRYKVGTTSPDTSDWATGWMVASTSVPPVPGAPGAWMTAQVTGLSPDTRYWFRLRTLDDNDHWSALSNAALIWTQAGMECDGGSSGGGGGGGFAAQRVTGPNSLRGPTTSGTFENSLLDGGPHGATATDALRVPSVPAGGPLRLWFRTHSGLGTAVDRARLLVVDHAADQEAYVASSGAVVGTTRPIASVRLADGGHLDATFRLADGGTLRPLPGDTLSVDLGENAGSTLVVEGRSTGGRGASEGLGFAVLARDADGPWLEIGAAALRSRTDRVAVSGLDGRHVLLAFKGGAELAGLWTLVPSATAPSVTAIAAARASGPASEDDTALTLDQDGQTVWLADLDTLHLQFPLPELAEGGSRAVFLELTGTPVSPGVARANRARPAPGTPPSAALDFALQPPRPNPGFGAVTIGFTLPEPAVARLEIFDAQGRRIREYVARYEAGSHHIDWDQRSSRGRRVAPGVYTCRLSAGRHEMRRKAVVLP